MTEAENHTSSIFQVYDYKGYRIIGYDKPIDSLKRYGIVDRLFRPISYSESLQTSELIIDNLKSQYELSRLRVDRYSTAKQD